MLSRWGKHPSRSFHGATHGSLGCPKSRVNVERFLPSRLCEPSARSAQCQGLALCGPQCSHVHRADSCTGGLAVTAFRHPSVGAATFATPRFDSRVNSRGSALYEAYLLRGYRPEQAPFLRRCEVCFAAAIHTWSLLASRFFFCVLLADVSSSMLLGAGCEAQRSAFGYGCKDSDRLVLGMCTGKSKRAATPALG